MERTARSVGALFKARRNALGKKQDAFGPTPKTIATIENGEVGPKSRSIAPYATALGWPADAWQRLVDGDDPETFVTDGQSGLTAGSALGELLGRPGQLIDERLTRLEAQMDAIVAILDETEHES